MIRNQLRILCLLLCRVCDAFAQTETSVCGADPPSLKWRDEEAAWLLGPAERSAFNRLLTAEQCREFIARFWQMRDPKPATSQNEFRIEHYRRLAYANARFSTALPGWRTDRGRIYILYGPPDRIESHPSGISYQRPKEEGGGTTSTYPFERWTYRSLPGVGDNIDIEFIDQTQSGEYKLLEFIDARRRRVLSGHLSPKTNSTP